MSVQGSITRGAVGMVLKDPEKFKKEIGPAIVISLVSMVAGLCALMYALDAKTLTRLVEDVQTPYAVIEAYSKWYQTLTIFTGLALALMIGGALVAIIIGRRSGIAIAVAVVIAGFGALICCVMYTSEDIAELKVRAQNDMAQIESGELETAVVCFHKNYDEKGLPGPYTQGQPTVLTLYSGIGDTTDGWEGFRVPDCLGFEVNSDGFYKESKNMDWNKENAQWYTVTYTTEFHVVTVIEAVQR